jgi:outer membrane receptor protein involved in Fe transport
VRKRVRIGAGQWGRAAGAGAVGALFLVAACRAPVPTEVGADDAAGTTVTLHEVDGAGASAGGTIVARGEEGVGTFRFRTPDAADGEAGGTLHFGPTDEATGATPRMFVDGVEISPAEVDAIDPDDVDRIEVIKGEAARAIWGDDASAGVVQIFLKDAPAARD